jgi:hypothetical protein
MPGMQISSSVAFNLLCAGFQGLCTAVCATSRTRLALDPSQFMTI